MTKKELIDYIKKTDLWIAEGPAILNMCYPWTIGTPNTKKYFKFGFNEELIAYDKNYVYQFLDEKANIKTTQGLISLYKKRLLSKKYRLWKKQRKTALDNFKYLDSLDLRKVNDQRIIKEYLNFMDIFTEQWTMPLILEGANIYIEKVTFPKLKEENKSLDNKTINEYFSQLTQPDEISFNNRERLNFLKICKGQRDISSHQKNYYWIRNNYLYARPIEEKEFSILVKEELRNKSIKQIDKEIKDINNYKEKTFKIKKDILSKIKISKSLEKEIEAISFIASWQDERKEMNLRGNHYIGRFLDEFSKRTEISYLDIGKTFPEEIGEILKQGKKKWLPIIKQRRDKFITMTIFGKGVSSFSGKDAEEIWKHLFKKEEDVMVLEGTIVSRAGVNDVEGYANIVLDPSKDKFTKGNILITSMTRPEFVPLMKKAKAIITNEGGVTCHAAILSRELNIPCIVGTKRATKIFKNGDLIRLKLNHGKIEKIN